MTNVQIVENNRQALIEAGIIGENDTIHTYEYWKAAGYQVKRGEKAIARFPIWKKGKQETIVEVKTEDGKQEKTIDTGRFFLKESCFFSSLQIEKASSKKPA